MKRTRASTTPKATQDQRKQEKEEQEKPESDEDIQAKIKKVIEELRRKATESNEKERDFVYPTDMSQEYKYYTEGGHIWRQSHARKEKGCDDYVFEHEKGKGKDQYGKKGGQGKENPKEEAGTGKATRICAPKRGRQASLGPNGQDTGAKRRQFT